MENSEIKDLYEGKKKIKVKFKERKTPFNITLYSYEYGKHKVDCKIESWTANRWFRTDKGVNYEKYKDLKELKDDVLKESKQRNLTIEKFIVA